MPFFFFSSFSAKTLSSCIFVQNVCVSCRPSAAPRFHNFDASSPTPLLFHLYKRLLRSFFLHFSRSHLRRYMYVLLRISIVFFRIFSRKAIEKYEKNKENCPSFFFFDFWGRIFSFFHFFSRFFHFFYYIFKLPFE